MPLTNAERQRAYRDRQKARQPGQVAAVARTGTASNPPPPSVVRQVGRQQPEGHGLLPVATQEQFDEAARRYATGEHWTDIAKALGIDWGMFMRRGQVEGNAKTWKACQDSNKLTSMKRIGERAERCAFDGVKRTTRRETGTDTKGQPVEKVIETEEHVADAAMARLALEAVAPEVHGKLAGAKSANAPAVAVQIINWSMSETPGSGTTITVPLSPTEPTQERTPLCQ